MIEELRPVLSETLQALAVAGIGAVIRYVRRINQRLDTLNGSVGKLKEWSVAHEAADAARFEALTKRRGR